MDPISYNEEGVAQFYADQYHPLFPPSDFGFPKYEIIERPEYVTDYDLERQYNMRKRPVHRYNPEERFRLVVAQILGQACGVSRQMLESSTWKTITAFVSDLPEENLYEGTRAILKHYRLNIYYNRIPSIIAMSGCHCKVTSKAANSKIENVIQDFLEMYRIFPTIKDQLKRSYFLGFRYIALKLLEKHAIKVNLFVPKARSPKKEEELNQVFDLIWNSVEEARLAEDIEKNL
jgi:hypothetical protein